MDDIDRMADPLGGAPRKQLHFFWIADCSGSMQGEKIESLNQAIRECLPATVEANADSPFAEMRVRAIKFASGAQWHVSEATPVEDFVWQDLSAGGVTDLGAALDLLSGALDVARMGRRNLPPVIVLLSDGFPTDDWEAALDRFNATPWGKPGRTTRVAIAIGNSADKEVLAKFTGNPETVFDAQNARQLRQLIRWASVVLSSTATQSRSAAQPTSEPTLLAPVPPLVTEPPAGEADLW